MTSFEIKKKLHLIVADVPKNDAPKAPESINHIWIYDRSGSMYSLLPSLADDLIRHSRTIPKGDTLTMAWFSGEGNYNVMIKGFKLATDKDYDSVAALIEQNKTTLGTTCFSEVLAGTDQILNDLKIFSDSFSLMFFTDGYPTVSNHEREVERVLAAIEKLSGKISRTLLVGYGDYYNKDLLTQMAEAIGGELIHSEELPVFSAEMRSFVSTRSGVMRQILNLGMNDDEMLAVFGLRREETDGKAEAKIVFYQPQQGNANVHSDLDKIFALVKGDVSDLKEEKSLDNAYLYAAACVLVQKAKADVAVDVLGKVGDVALIDMINSAWTNAEYGAAEAAIRAAIFDEAKRFTKGKKAGYVPAPDAFCLLNALDLLMSDSDAKFYPYHPDFHYKRIGVPAKPVEGYPKFKAEENPSCSLNTLKWHESRLNLSVLARINGSVELNGDVEKHKLPKVYPTWIYRNYAIVKDGNLNVATLPVSMSKLVFGILQQNSMIAASESWKEGMVYLVNLRAVPVINRQIASGRTSAKTLAKYVWNEIQLEGKIKALNAILDRLDPNKESKRAADLTAEQEEFLKQSGIGRNGFAPPTEKGESEDFYMAKEFEIKVKGFSSFPKVSEVEEKAAAGKKLTPSGEVVLSGVKMFQDEAASKPLAEQLKWLNGKTGELKKELGGVRKYLQETKFAVILAKQWFDEFKSRNENALTENSIQYTFELSESKVEY
jgi:hypothetical protein